MLAAVSAAILVHVGLIFAIPFLTSLDTAPLPDYGPIIVTLEEPEAVLEPPAPKVVPAVPAAAARAAPAPTAKPTPAAAPSAAQPLATAPEPAPRRAPGTSAFRQSGTITGTSAGTAAAQVVSAPPPVTLPAVGTTAPGSGQQRGGEGATLSGKPAGSGGSLTPAIAKVDTALAGAPGSSATAPTSGGAADRAASGAGIAWENPSAAKGRRAISVQDVPWPTWVKESGQVLEVRIEFSVDAAGMVTSATVLQGSGYTDVDDACRKAMLKYKFTPSQGAPVIRGVALFTTVLKS
jgi:TonB family protein